MTEQQPDQNDKPNTKSPGLFSVIQSVLAAMFGIQSDEKREQDFANGNPVNFIVIGIVMVMIFIMTLVAIVNSILDK
jgi:hypothetical protein